MPKIAGRHSGSASRPYIDLRNSSESYHRAPGPPPPGNRLSKGVLSGFPRQLESTEPGSETSSFLLRILKRPMSDYYDYHPLVSLDRPLVLSGFLSAECRKIGYQLAALTGLTATDLDRAIEHEAGKSVWELILMEGENRYRRLERELLQRQLRARPAGVLTLGDGTLIDPENRRLLRAESRWVLLDLDLANCFWRLTAASESPIQRWHPLYAGPLTSPDLMRPFYDLRRPGFDEAPEKIDLRGKSGLEAVEELLELLG